MRLPKKISKIKVKINFSKKKRQWGDEILLYLISKTLSLKILKIKKGKKGGLQYHRKKNECGILIKGLLRINYSDDGKKIKTKILKKGNVFHFPPGSIHQEHALTNCEIIEASTPHFNDRVRVENIFNMKEDLGLKTTALKSIILR
jgi:mannose-6-phosphate isomerase